MGDGAVYPARGFGRHGTVAPVHHDPCALFGEKRSDFKPDSACSADDDGTAPGE
jgi:hypothetical protein